MSARISLAEQEHEAEDILPAAAREFIQAIAPIWHFGDGHGGYVLRAIQHAAAGTGLPVRDGVPHRVTRVELLAERDGGYYCWYCGSVLAGHPGVPSPEIDHVVPRALGGTDALANLVLSCGPCNGRKGTMSEDAYRHMLRSRR